MARRPAAAAAVLVAALALLLAGPAAAQAPTLANNGVPPSIVGMWDDGIILESGEWAAISFTIGADGFGAASVLVVDPDTNATVAHSALVYRFLSWECVEGLVWRAFSEVTELNGADGSTRTYNSCWVGRGGGEAGLYYNNAEADSVEACPDISSWEMYTVQRTSEIDFYLGLGSGVPPAESCVLA